MTWAYGDRPVDKVELRLSPDKDGDTVLELEHATVSKLVEWDGQMLDVIPGVGAGWEPALDYLRKFLRHELPDAPPRTGMSQRRKTKTKSPGTARPGRLSSKPPKPRAAPSRLPPRNNRESSGHTV